MADIILPKVPEGSSFEILEKVLSDEKYWSHISQFVMSKLI